MEDARMLWRSSPILIAGILCAPNAHALGTVEVISPVEDTIAVGDRVPVIIAGCALLLDARVKLDGRRVRVRFSRDVFAGRWLGFVDLGSKGTHVLEVQGRCLLQTFGYSVRFTNDHNDSADVAREVADQYIADHPADTLSWNWGEAVFLYSLLEFAQNTPAGGGGDIDYIRRYHDHYATVGLPAIDNADKCAPALTALGLHLETGDHRYLPQADVVMDYVRNAPLNALGTLNHLGTSLESLFYPDSIWIDSLMMWTLVSYQYAAEFSDPTLESFALDQPDLYRSVLEDLTSGLYFHAWNTEKDVLLPPSNVPWLRGNGWAMAFLVEMLDDLPPQSPEFGDLSAQLASMASAARSVRLPSGLWDTVVTQPGAGYEETSGSALVAYAFAKGARLGVLPPEYRDVAKETFVALSARLRKGSAGYALDGISAPTNPFPQWLYALWPRTTNAPYGVGALLLLGTELSGEVF
jgi:unsaturated rhamnogalacturonyl hydrolase